MKIIHTSDIHIDSPLTARLSSERLKERRRELLQNFARLISEAKALSAGAIIVAGDLFDSEKISKRTLDTALDAIESSPEITFFYLEGNHEGRALRDSGRTLPGNLITFGEDWTYYTAGGVTVVGRSTLSADMFSTLTLSPDTKNIVVLHGELREGASSDTVIGLADAAGKNVDYLALGHYHAYSRTKIDARGVAVYSGCPEGRGFDECGDKGYVIIDTDGRALDGLFKKFAKRRHHVVPVDITGAARPSEIVARSVNAVSGIPMQDIVRIELCGSYSPETFKDTEAIAGELSGKFFCFEVKDSSRVLINPDDYKFDKTLKGEFIRTVSTAPELSEEMRAKIILCGINALMGEDLF